MDGDLLGTSRLAVVRDNFAPGGRWQGERVYNRVTSK